VVRGDRIIRLIRRSEAAAHTGPNTRVLDLGKRPLLPGFVDAHAHTEVVSSVSYGSLDCRAPECSSISDLSDVFLSGIKSRRKGEWVVGQANLFFEKKLKEGRLPTRSELDRLSTDHPIALRAGGHVTVLNSKALEVSGIDRNFVEPTHSITGIPEVERDADGNPTGVVKEMDSLLPLPKIEASELKAALLHGFETYFTRYGVTCVGEFSNTVAGIESMGALATAGNLPLSLRVYIWSPGTLEVAQACKWQDHIELGAPESLVRIQGIKLFSDGGFTAKNAAMNCCYVGSDTWRGEIAFPKYFLRKAYESTQAAGLQLAVHANGDRAQEWVCGIISELGGGSSGRTRTRIEHAGNLLPTPRTSEYWAKAGIFPVPQAPFIYASAEFFPDYMGEYGSRGRFPFKTLMRDGWRLGGSSDVYIGSEREATNPLFNIWCCMKRESYSGQLIDPHEALSFEEALQMHTLDAAASMGEDDVRGSLAPGKYADIIALDLDPLSVPVDAIRKLSVDFVMSLGRVIRRPGEVQA